MSAQHPPAYRSGFVALMGRPNVGKSTLLNALVGQKIAIVSPKPQTTRNRILGVRHFEAGQAVFLDTPGLHEPRHLLGNRMMKSAMGALAGVDVACLVADLSRARPGEDDERAAAALAGAGAPLLLIGNKLDLVPGDGAAAERLARYAGMLAAAAQPPVAMLAVSAATGVGLNDLIGAIRERLPEGPPYFPEDQVTDQPEQRIMAELVREQLLLRLRDEVPHGAAVGIDEVAARPRGLVYVAATIYLDRESQKPIVLGRGGAMLKAVGQGARAGIEAVLGSRVYLDLRVKVKPGWRNRAGSLEEFGLKD